MIPPSEILPVQLEAMCELARATPPGPFVEVGVYKGGSAWHLMNIAKETERPVHLFDTFTGIPVQDDIDNHKIGDFNDVDLLEVRKAIPNAWFHVGLFPGTFRRTLFYDGIAFAHIDCDQYQSVKDCIEHLWPIIVSGGVMLFDDFDCTRGCTKAVKEHFAEFELTPSGRAFVRKQ